MAKSSSSARSLGLWASVAGALLLSVQPQSAFAQKLLDLNGGCVNVVGVKDFGSVDWPAMREQLRHAGVTQVRVPLNVEANVGSKDPYEVNPTFLNDVAQMVRGFTSDGFSVILDGHSFSAVKENPDVNTPRLTAFWATAARVWRDLPSSVAYEILNEPGVKINADNLVDVLKPALVAIRKVDPQRKVIVGGAWASSVGALNQTRPLLGPNVEATFHFYSPMAFTHQGASWNKTFRTSGKLGLPANYQKVLERAVAQAKAFRNATGHEVLVGEVGVIASVPRDQRLVYLAAATQAFSDAGMRTCLWSWPVARDVFDIRELVAR